MPALSLALKPMSDPVATVIIPTFDHGATIRLAIETALWQTVPVEVIVVGDGVPPASRALIREIEAGEPRVRFIDQPKHPRRGEPYRHAALEQARGQVVCYLCDRDLWFPDHVEKLAALLTRADFAHAFPLHLLPNGVMKFFSGNLAEPFFRERARVAANSVPLSCAAHTLAFYRTLSEGWSSTPDGQPTDWHFFRKFLDRADCRCVSGMDITALTFPSPPRRGWSESQRFEELAAWRARIDTRGGRTHIALHLMKLAVAQRDRELAKVYQLLRPGSRRRPPWP